MSTHKDHQLPKDEQSTGRIELTRAILQTVLDGIITIDTEGIVQSFNRAAERLFGYTAEETIGQNVTMLMPSPPASGHDSYLKRYLATGQRYIIGAGREVEGRRKDGSLFPLHLGVSEAQYGGRNIFVGVMRDLSAQRRAERQRDRFFATTPDLICTIGADGYFRQLNPAWEKSLGYSERELRSQFAQSFMHPDDPALIPVVPEQATAPTPPFIESRIRCKDGLYKWMEWVVVPEGEEDGLLLAAARDVNERKEVDRLKSEFVSIVSHELRTPLTSIRGSLGLLEHGTAGLDKSKQQDLVRIARENTDRLIRLINDVLDLEKIESGKLELQTQLIDVETLADEASSNVAAMAEQREITIEQHIEAGTWVVADKDRTVQILVNLLGNAIKFSPPGSTVAIETSVADPHVRFAILDQGPGISPEHEARLFNKFEQLDTSDRRTKGGSGLGLAISKAIVEQHGGSIGVRSLSGRGSEFFFTLPSQKGKSELPSVETDLTAESAHRLLVVEDNPDVAQVIQTLLEREGYTVAGAPTLAQAKASFKRRPFDVVLLDIGLPDGSGIDFLQWLRSQDEAANVPAIVISGRGEDAAANAVGGPMPVHWLNKPCSGADILQAVRRAVHEPGTDPLVLIVEDDEATRRVVSEQLRQLGASCLEAAGGVDAMRLMETRRPDLLVLDVSIEDIDGFELVERFRRGKARTIPMVVYTSRDLSARERQQLTLGATRHLIKSRTTQDQFVSAVRDLLDGLLPNVPPPG